MFTAGNIVGSQAPETTGHWVWTGVITHSVAISIQAVAWAGHWVVVGRHSVGVFGDEVTPQMAGSSGHWVWTIGHWVVTVG